MQDGTFITRAFVVVIIVMLIYAFNSHMEHKENLEKLVIDQQSVIEEQNIAIQHMQQANMLMYQYISQQQQQPNVLH